jgi:hypothetical protein
MSKQPLGAELPSRVPCPPAIKTTATLFAATSFRPDSYHFWKSEGSESRMEAVATSGRGSRVTAPCSAGGGLRALSASSLIRVGSKLDSWWKSCDFSTVVNSSAKAKTWPCPASVYFFCSAWNSSTEGSRGTSGAVPWSFPRTLETASLITPAIVKIYLVIEKRGEIKSGEGRGKRSK